MASTDYVRRAAAARRRRLHGRGYATPVGGVEKTVTFAPGTPLTVRAWMALTPDFTIPWWEWGWVDITAYVRWDPGVVTSQGRRERDTASIVTAGTARATLNNSDGRFSRQNPLSPYYGQLTRFTPIRFAVDPGTGMSHRFFGHVNSWPKRWDRSGNNVTIPIVCRGPLHRVARKQTELSALYRSIMGANAEFTPVAYWPMEEAAGATEFLSPIAGVEPLAVGTYVYVGAGPGTITAAAESSLPGSKPLPVFGIAVSKQARIADYTDTGQWVWQIMLRVTAELAASPNVLGLLDLRTSNTALPYVFALFRGNVTVTTSQIDVQVYDSAVSLTDTVSITVNNEDVLDKWVAISITSKQDGNGAQDTLSFTVADTNGDALGSVTQDIDANFHGKLVTGGILAPSGVDVDHTDVFVTGGAAWGHPVFYTDPSFVGGTDDFAYARAAGGHVGEMAHERIARLCAEEQITLRYNTVRSLTLGPQPVARLVSLLQDAAKAAQGVIYEYEFGLGFQAISERYNQAYALTLDIASGHVVNDLEPDDSDLRFHNQWTASRSGGSSYTYPPAGTLASTDLVYDASDTFGVESDNQLPLLAGWLTHTDTTDDDYWPNIAFNLAKHPALIPAWTAMGYGQRVRVQNLMSQAGVSEIDAIVEGHAEKWNSLQWGVVLNTSPASVYTVGTTDHSTRAKTQASGCTLGADVAVGGTSLTVNIAAGKPLWTTSPSNLSALIGGEAMPISAISGASSPQTFTVTRTVAKAHAAGATVKVYQAAVAGL